VEDVHHFDIDMTLAGDGTTVIMDGKRLTGVRSFRIDCGIDQVSRITLEILGTANLAGDGQVWVKPPTDEMAERIEAAEIRAEEAEARAEAAEAKDGDSVLPPGGTLAYIVPVDPAAPPQIDGKGQL
jgi:hypothetical protein